MTITKEVFTSAMRSYAHIFFYVTVRFYDFVNSLEYVEYYILKYEICLTVYISFNQTLIKFLCKIHDL